MIESGIMERGVRIFLMSFFRSGAAAIPSNRLARTPLGNGRPFTRRRSRRLGWLLIGVAAGLWTIAAAQAHDLPYGQVERAIQVTAYLQHIEVQYQFGMHDRMIWEQLHGVEDAASHEVELLDRDELSRLEMDFLAHVADQLASWVELEVAGERWECTELTTELIYQHHLQFECRLRFDCPVNVEFSERTALRLTDGGFANFPGHYRAAVRGRGGVEATSDTTALLLVRAPRLPILAETRGRLVVPPIQATLGGSSRRGTTAEPSDSRPKPDEPSLSPTVRNNDAEAGSELSLRESEPGPSEVSNRESRDAEASSSIEPSASAVAAERQGADSKRLESDTRRRGTRGLPGWLLTSLIALAVLSCLPLLLLSPRRRDPGRS